MVVQEGDISLDERARRFLVKKLENATPVKK